MDEPKNIHESTTSHPAPIPQMLGASARSPDDPYFFNLDRELIEQRRRGLDESRAEQAKTSEGSDYWMRCPKCGGGMITKNYAHVQVDKCTSCRGVFLDRGELDLVLAANQPNRFLDAINRLFDPGDVNPNLF